MLCLLFSRTDGSGLTQFSSLFLSLFSFGGKKKQHKNQSFFSHFVTAGYQSISIDSTVMLAHDVQGPDMIGLHFSAVFHIRKKKKRYLYVGDCQHMIVPLSLIKRGNNDCLYTGLRLAYFTINHPVSVRISSPVKFFLRLFFSYF